MLYEWLKGCLGPDVAPFAAITLLLVIVGASLWMTPKLAKWIDNRKKDNRGFFDDMMEHPPEGADQE